MLRLFKPSSKQFMIESKDFPLEMVRSEIDIYPLSTGEVAVVGCPRHDLVILTPAETKASQVIATGCTGIVSSSIEDEFYFSAAGKGHDKYTCGKTLWKWNAKNGTKTEIDNHDSPAGSICSMKMIQDKIAILYLGNEYGLLDIEKGFCWVGNIGNDVFTRPNTIIVSNDNKTLLIYCSHGFSDKAKAYLVAHRLDQSSKKIFECSDTVFKAHAIASPLISLPNDQVAMGQANLICFVDMVKNTGTTYQLPVGFNVRTLINLPDGSIAAGGTCAEALKTTVYIITPGKEDCLAIELPQAKNVQKLFFNRFTQQLGCITDNKKLMDIDVLGYKENVKQELLDRIGKPHLYALQYLGLEAAPTPKPSM